MPDFTMEVVRIERTLITIEADAQSQALDRYDADPDKYNADFEFVSTEDVQACHDTIKETTSTYLIPVKWQMKGLYKVEALTPEAAEEAVDLQKRNITPFPPEPHNYVMGSWELGETLIEEKDKGFDLKCPACGNLVEFSVEGDASITVTGSRLEGTDFDWSNYSSMSCGKCGHDGRADDFSE